VLANTKTKYHEIFKAGINIGGRKTYNGEGFYNYVDAQKKKQEFLLDSIWVNRSLQTRAAGKISKEANFTLNPHFGYAGNVFLNAEEEFLNLRGTISLKYDCGTAYDTAEYAPIRFTGVINPDSVLIPIGKGILDADDRPVSAAIASSARSGQIYTAFGRSKPQLNDAEYVSARGYLTFNEELNSYIVASREKIDDLEMEGNIVSLNKKNCVSRGEGKLDLGTNLGRVTFIPLGNITHYIRDDSAIINIAIAIDFLFNDASMGIMADHIASSHELEGIDVMGLPHYQTALKEIMGSKEYRQNYPEFAQYNFFRKLPKSLQINFLIADIKMEWKQENRAFVCKGNIGFAVCGKKEINRYIPGIVEIEKKGIGKNERTTLQIYFEVDKQWFYFKYSGTTMEALSSIKEFNEEIKNTKAEKKNLPADSKKGLAKYSYKVAGNTAKRKFVEKHEKDEE